MSAMTDALDPDQIQELIENAVHEDLEPITPTEALDMYTGLREDDVSPSTLRTHLSRLQFLVDWCEQNNIQNMNDLSGRHLQEFRNWRKQDLADASLQSNLQTLRVFLRKCVKFDAVSSSLPEKVEVPSGDDSSRETLVSAEQAKAILAYLRKYEYAEPEHVAWELMVAAGLRLSSMRALDVRDFTSTADGGELDLNHRPDSETPLKNKNDSERVVHVSNSVQEVIKDYLADKRPDTVDSYGRAPLLASRQGRLTPSAIRKYAYKWTRPCAIGQSCPHDKNPEECRAAQQASTAYECPGSSSPHTTRRGYITHELSSGVPKVVVSDRCDVSPDIIDEHYDERKEGEKMQLRKEIRESTYADHDSDGYGC